MRETTSREFLEWMEYLDKEEWQKHHREDFYLAQIAMEVARTRVRNPGSLKAENYLLKFVTRGEAAAPVSQEEVEERTAMSKGKWFTLTGVGRKPPPQAAPITPPPATGRRE